jgi:hypothetical protein
MHDPNGGVGRERSTRLHMLPFAAPDFAGREDEIRLIRAWIRNPPKPPKPSAEPPPVLINLYGMPGSGKSALAIHAAHLLGDEDYGCQLYFDLRDSFDRPSRQRIC